MAQRGHAPQKRGSRRSERSVRMAASGLVGEVYRPGAWGPGVASFENDAAGNWFLLVEEGRDPGAVIACAIDDVAGAAEPLEIDACCEAIAAAVLGACSAGQLPDRLADNVHGWVRANPHGPHADEVELAAHAVTRMREESELCDL